LLSCLSSQQRAQFRRSGSFEVIGRSGNRYLISPRRMGNIFLLDERGRAVGRYCSLLKGDAPIEDQMLAQKLMLESDESRLLQVAHRTLVRLPRLHGEPTVIRGL
jgi:hypothetical protein